MHDLFITCLKFYLKYHYHCSKKKANVIKKLLKSSFYFVLCVIFYFLQIMYATQTLGHFISPLIVAPFLVDLPSSDTPNNNNTSDSISNVSMSTEITTSGYRDRIPEGVQKVRYPYMIAGIIMVVVSFTFLAPLVVGLKAKKKQEMANKEQEMVEEDKDNQSKTRNNKFKVFLLGIMFVYSFFMVSFMLTLFTMISAFVIR